MRERVINSFWLVAIVSSIICVFHISGCVFLIILSGICTQIEFCTLIEKSGQKPFKITSMICGLALMLTAAYKSPASQWLSQSSEFMFFSITIIALQALFSNSLRVAQKSIISSVASIVYGPFLFSFPIALLREMKLCGLGDGVCIFTFLWMVFVTKACDIGGMFAGKYFGKTKIAPNFSPKKTVEGLIGGVICSIIVGFLLFWIFRKFLPQKFYFCKAAILSVLLAVLSLVGDLVESILKRSANEKDSGKIFSGIGGMFDLTDSLLLSLPFASIFIKNFAL